MLGGQLVQGDRIADHDRLTDEFRLVDTRKKRRRSLMTALNAMSIAATPCETFAETGLAIKRRSPFQDTFTIELANGADGYLPTIEQHGYGGYETWLARSSCLEITAERKIRSALLDMLKQLEEGR